MRIFLWLLFLFAAAIGLAVAARFNPGNVVFFYPPYRIDLSLNFFLLGLCLFFVLTYFVFKAINATRKLPQRVAAYRREKREREGLQALHESLKAYFEGRFGQSEKAAVRAVEIPGNKGLAALIGARAAHRLQQSVRRDAWLSSIESEPSLKTARLMTAIELLIDERRPEAAMESVNELNESGVRHIHAQRLALKVNQRAENWPEVLRLTRTLDKNNALHPALSQRLREMAYEALFSDPSHDDESIRRLWFSIPAEERQHAFIAVRAADAFNSRKLHSDASKILENALTVHWDSQLLRAYRDAAAEEGSPALLAQIERCEQWLSQHQNDVELLLTLGVLCLKQNLWGKAQRYLELALSHSITGRAKQECHLKLAQLNEMHNKPEAAALHYRQCALATDMSSTPEYLPMTDSALN